MSKLKTVLPVILSVSLCNALVIGILWYQCPTPSTSQRSSWSPGYFSKYWLQAEKHIETFLEIPAINWNEQLKCCIMCILSPKNCLGDTALGKMPGVPLT